VWKSDFLLWKKRYLHPLVLFLLSLNPQPHSCSQDCRNATHMCFRCFPQHFRSAICRLPFVLPRHGLPVVRRLNVNAIKYFPEPIRELNTDPRCCWKDPRVLTTIKRQYIIHAYLRDCRGCQIAVLSESLSYHTVKHEESSYQNFCRALSAVSLEYDTW
jgi:hypothetical protein